MFNKMYLEYFVFYLTSPTVLQFFSILTSRQTALLATHVVKTAINFLPSVMMCSIVPTHPLAFRTLFFSTPLFAVTIGQSQKTLKMTYGSVETRLCK